MDPFAEVAVTVINSVPLDPRSVRSLRVDAAHTGPTGARDRRSLTLDPGRPIERFTAHYPRFTDDFALEAEAVASLTPAPGTSWPVRVGPVALATADHVIRVTPDALGVSVVRAEADPGFFALAAAAEVTLTRAGRPVAVARLTADEPAAALVVPGAEPLDATVEALESGGQRIVVARHHGTPAIRVPASAVQVIAPDEITVRLTDDAAALPYLALTLTDPRATPGPCASKAPPRSAGRAGGPRSSRPSPTPTAWPTSPPAPTAAPGRWPPPRRARRAHPN
ncbi:hypothetical protein ACFQV2_20730 [Actinokineospora soli]|uniref:Uncharacterized protein n=1 Tax=Actinokineospora soli TaxID=1048753 RepID=A0ABW2TQA9_9PSEU